MAPSDADAIARFRAGLPAETLATVDALRAIASAAHPDLIEGFKWNAPSFAVAGEHRITLGTGPKGQVRAVLHRGAKPKDSADFRFDDPDGLARWPDPDRGVLMFGGVGEVSAKADALRVLFAGWIEATA